MIRASFYLPAPLIQRLQLIAKRKNLSASDFVRTMLDREVSREEQSELRDQYAAWEEVKGIIKDPVSDASTTIDTVLYGENSVWQGRGE